jgi:hypothetical protein
MLFNDVDPITKFGAWGAQEYGGQVGAPKQVAVDRFLKRSRLSWLTTLRQPRLVVGGCTKLLSTNVMRRQPVYAFCGIRA